VAYRQKGASPAHVVTPMATPLDIPASRVYTLDRSEQLRTPKGVMRVEELISIPEAARHLGVSETIIRRWIKRGDLQPAKVDQLGRQTRRYVRSADVEALRKQRGGADKV
jgi:excisionase family DNA binding protein